MKTLKIILGALATVLIPTIFFMAIVAGLTFLLQYLWNWIMPYLFGLPKISFWMALGVAMLTSIVFNRSSK